MTRPEWPFHVKFSLLRTAVSAIRPRLGYIFIVALFIEYLLLNSSAEYLGSAEGLRIFRGRYIVGTLTNKAIT